MPTEAEVRAALDEVIHPSFGLSLIALGMVRAVRVYDRVIEVDLVMNCPAARQAKLRWLWRARRSRCCVWARCG
jgi:metal-sulfur cluster biosynthetic enzyme